ncbi:hypothetical protein SKAU_G00172980 [Synaphobranchus kaupii]|uniref:Uncharacterized protein n=1 Tax=Synaphobranchus kaupii TaxID=118154 RepID=A0A9Q1FKN5_SYNKA|nr:hypothetical protein SKAU_G00172980 [Synaphobranchus kaupii]
MKGEAPYRSGSGGSLARGKCGAELSEGERKGGEEGRGRRLGARDRLAGGECGAELSEREGKGEGGESGSGPGIVRGRLPSLPLLLLPFSLSVQSPVVDEGCQRRARRLRVTEQSDLKDAVAPLLPNTNIYMAARWPVSFRRGEKPTLADTGPGTEPRGACVLQATCESDSTGKKQSSAIIPPCASEEAAVGRDRPAELLCPRGRSGRGGSLIETCRRLIDVSAPRCGSGAVANNGAEAGAPAGGFSTDDEEQEREDFGFILAHL